MDKLLVALDDGESANFAQFPKLVDPIDEMTQICSQAKFAEQIFKVGISIKSIKRLQADYIFLTPYLKRLQQEITGEANRLMIILWCAN